MLDSLYAMRIAKSSQKRVMRNISRIRKKAVDHFLFNIARNRSTPVSGKQKAPLFW